MWETRRPPYPNELFHHGVKGMHWGVRNGPPYPLGGKNGEKTRISNVRSRSAVNDIYNSMTKQEQIYIAGEIGNPVAPKTYATAKMYGPKGTLIDTAIVYKGKVPVAFYDCWDHMGSGGKIGEICIGTRGGSNYRGKGYATMALKDGIEAFKANPNMKELRWYADNNNISSINLAKKMGFKVMTQNDYYTGLRMTKR